MVMDEQPRHFDAHRQQVLCNFAELVVRCLEEPRWTALKACLVGQLALRPSCGQCPPV